MHIHYLCFELSLHSLMTTIQYAIHQPHETNIKTNLKQHAKATKKQPKVLKSD